MDIFFKNPDIVLMALIGVQALFLWLLIITAYRVHMIEKHIDMFIARMLIEKHLVKDKLKLDS